MSETIAEGIWKIHKDGSREFSRGREDWAAAATVAAGCPGFRLDVEEELVAEEQRSCYNCRYRRWTATSFNCQGKGGGDMYSI